MLPVMWHVRSLLASTIHTVFTVTQLKMKRQQNKDFEEEEVAGGTDYTEVKQTWLRLQMMLCGELSLSLPHHGENEIHGDWPEAKCSRVSLGMFQNINVPGKSRRRSRSRLAKALAKRASEAKVLECQEGAPPRWHQCPRERCGTHPIFQNTH